jgi:hypothetical protein
MCAPPLLMSSMLLTISRIRTTGSECAVQNHRVRPVVSTTKSSDPHARNAIDEVILRRFPNGQRVAGKQVSSSEIHRNR